MAKVQFVKLKSDGTPTGTKIFIDGVELLNVSSIFFSVDSANRGKIMLEMVPDEIEVEGETEVFEKPVGCDHVWLINLGEPTKRCDNCQQIAPLKSDDLNW